jgi:hypothetical protein
MSKGSTRAEAAAEQAEARALLELAEQSARHAAVAAEDRAARERMLRNFRDEMDRDRREFMAQQAEATTAAVTPPVTPAATQPRDASTGRWLPAAPQPEPAPEVDLSTLSLAEYAALRGQLGIDKAGVEHVGRAPGHERAEYMGHRIEDGSGFSDWRDFTANNRVFRGQLPDQRKPVPVGFIRPDTGEWL